MEKRDARFLRTVEEASVPFSEREQSHVLTVSALRVEGRRRQHLKQERGKEPAMGGGALSSYPSQSQQRETAPSAQGQVAAMVVTAIWRRQWLEEATPAVAAEGQQFCGDQQRGAALSPGQVKEGQKWG